MTTRATVAHGPQIHLTNDGPFFRVRVEPRDALPSSVRQPETHAGHWSATMAARVLSNATNFPIVDLTKEGRGNG